MSEISPREFLGRRGGNVGGNAIQSNVSREGFRKLLGRELVRNGGWGAIEWDCRQGEVKVRGMWDGRQPKRIINEIIRLSEWQAKIN